jgi:hypothetical protein
MQLTSKNDAIETSRLLSRTVIVKGFVGDKLSLSKVQTTRSPFLGGQLSGPTSSERLSLLKNEPLSMRFE